MRYLPLCCLLLYTCAALAAPLTLTISADRTALFATPIAYFRADANAPRYQITPAKLSITFTNTGETPLKLCLYTPTLSSLHLHVSGPGAVEQQLRILFELPAPRADSFPTLAPGQSYTLPYQPEFPGAFGQMRYLLQQLGDYRLYLTYANTPAKGLGRFEQLDFARGCWQGAVSSNTLTFTLLQPGQASDGLRMALDVRPDAAPGSPAVKTVAYVQNVSEGAITVPAWDLQRQGLLVCDAEGKTLPMTGGAKRAREPKPEELYAVIAPNAIRAFPIMHAQYLAAEPAGEAPGGHFNLEDGTGYVRSWSVDGPHTTVQAVLSKEFQTIEGVPNPLWQGRVTSQPVTVRWDLTAYRKQRLLAAPENLVARLVYSGDQGKPFYALSLQVPPLPPIEEVAFRSDVQLTADEARALIETMANTGILRDAEPIAPLAAAPVPPTGYYLTILGGPHDSVAIKAYLGWDMAMLRRVEALRQALPAEKRSGMALFLGRLSGLRALWEAEEALHRRITLSTAKMTLRGAVTAICGDNVPYRIDEWMTLLPAPALEFVDVPANEALKAFAESADVSIEIRNGLVVVRPWLK